MLRPTHMRWKNVCECVFFELCRSVKSIFMKCATRRMSNQRGQAKQTKPGHEQRAERMRNSCIDGGNILWYKSI